MLIIIAARHKEEGRPTYLPPNHTTRLDFDIIRNWNNYSDIGDSFYRTVGWGAEEKESDLQNVATRLLALLHHRSDAPDTL